MKTERLANPRSTFYRVARPQLERFSARSDLLTGFDWRKRQAGYLNRAQQVFVSERQQKLFIQNTWLRLAAIACHEYLLKGRGAVIVDFRTARGGGSATYNCSAEYFALQEGKPVKLAGFNLAETLREMARYDPEREVLFICISPDGQFASYRTAYLPRPSRCLLLVEVLGAV